MAKKKVNKSKARFSLSRIPFAVLIIVATILASIVGASLIYDTQAQEGTTGYVVPGGARYNITVSDVDKD